jgi:hypothetical protein
MIRQPLRSELSEVQRTHPGFCQKLAFSNFKPLKKLSAESGPQFTVAESVSTFTQLES